VDGPAHSRGSTDRARGTQLLERGRSPRARRRSARTASRR
jgi:hypothetical protein